MIPNVVLVLFHPAYILTTCQIQNSRSYFIWIMFIFLHMNIQYTLFYYTITEMHLPS